MTRMRHIQVIIYNIKDVGVSVAEITHTEKWQTKKSFWNQISTDWELRWLVS